jgi:hypothetical protein
LKSSASSSADGAAMPATHGLNAAAGQTCIGAQSHCLPIAPFLGQPLSRLAGRAIKCYVRVFSRVLTAHSKVLRRSRHYRLTVTSCSGLRLCLVTVTSGVG